jgi:hypothetical protein
MQGSEVARIRQRIEQEYQAAKSWQQEYSIVSRHSFISARLNRIAEYHTLLADMVGDQEAYMIVCEAQARIII